jgi:prophage maintenance system killer protein
MEVLNDKEEVDKWVGEVWFDVVEEGFNTFVKLVAEFYFLVSKNHTIGRHLKVH